MNSLQDVSKKNNYFISVNGAEEVDCSKIIWETQYTHPLFDVGSIKGQINLRSLNERGPVYFCGAYFGYGFHEDGLKSGLDVAGKLNVLAQQRDRDMPAADYALRAGAA